MHNKSKVYATLIVPVLMLLPLVAIMPVSTTITNTPTLLRVKAHIERSDGKLYVATTDYEYATPIRTHFNSYNQGDLVAINITGMIIGGADIWLFISESGGASIGTSDMLYAGPFVLSDIQALVVNYTKVTDNTSGQRFWVGNNLIIGPLPAGSVIPKSVEYYVKMVDVTPSSSISSSDVAVSVNKWSSYLEFEVVPSFGAGQTPIELKGYALPANGHANLSYNAGYGWRSIDYLYPTDLKGSFTYVMTAPDLGKVLPAGLTSENYSIIIFRMIVNETGQTMTGTFGQYWRGLESVYSPDSVNLTAVSGYLFGNGTDFLYYGLNVRMGSTFTISGKWFSFGAITILWDGTTVIDSTMSDQNGSFKTTLTVPPHTSEGRHNVVVKDANVKFTFKLNCLPLIDTQPPVANARSILTIPENTLVIFDGSRSTDNIGIASYVWSFIDVTTHLLTGVNPAYNFTRPGTYFVLLNVTDFGGNWDTDTTIVKVLDTIPPIADVGPNRTIDEDASVTFDGSNSYDNVGITKYMWTISDFNETFFSTKITYTFMKPGVYTVTLTVFDAAGNQGMDVAFVTVRDITPPVANAGSNRTVMEDTIVTFDGSFSRDIYIGIVSYKWDFGDGSKGIGQIANHTYTNPGRYNVTLTVKDAANNSDSASITVTVMRNNINEQPLIFSYLIPVTVLAAIMAAIVIALFAKVKVKITREEFVQRELSLFRDQFADLEKKNLIYYEWKLTTIRQEAEKKFDELRQKGYLVSNLVELRQVLARKLRYNIKRLKGKRKKNK